MDWYYESSSGQAGPVSEESIKELARTGQIRNSTLVWHEGMEDWKSYGELMGLSGSTTRTESALQGVCSECGQAFPVDDLIIYGNARVCAQCKPLFVQKIKEGVKPQMGFVYAGFWLRLGAKIIDWMIMSGVNFIVMALFGVLIAFTGSFNPESGPPVVFIILQIFNSLLSLLLPIAYSTWLVGKYGATVGKMACKIKVVGPEGEKVSYLRAMGRAFAEILSGLILAIGYIMAAFDSEKRALHDHICSTRVVKAG